MAIYVTMEEFEDGDIVVLVGEYEETIKRTAYCFKDTHMTLYDVEHMRQVIRLKENWKKLNQKKKEHGMD